MSIALALVASRPNSTLSDIGAPLQVSVLVLGAISIVTHGILLYRVHKGTGLTREESAKLAVALKFGVGYSAWRHAIRRDKA